ncbi:hypothetical protein [Nitrosomonas marina]|uniref:Uncharacterized protein n=1 Tax=Nitrosomonas marina TaxID=917 RepID=A0A1H8IM85_9PROT|nr:hypothetical protein [Nitrosomonas marina]SEN69126.1 hypothetical protein SAMN05216325_1353 [Nitrosomonas marina]
MANTPSLENKTLSSAWDGLSPHLIASIYQVERTENGLYARTKNTDPDIVQSPFSEASMEISLNWQSAFEHSGPENRAPTLLAMLQSGALQPIIDAVADLVGDGSAEGLLRGVAANAQQESNRFIKQFEGRTGITKLNSTQVFNGMPPVKFQVTALFRAWRDPYAEVEAPFEKLMSWALPVKLSPDGSVLARSVNSARGETGFIDALVPSIAPVTVALQYKGRTYAPLVIESIADPLSSPIDVKGHFVEKSVPMTLATLTAIDRTDWSSYKRIDL